MEYRHLRSVVIYALESGFRRALLKETMIFDRPPLNPLPWGGEEMSAGQMTYSPSLGDPIENPSCFDTETCPQWV